MLSMRTVGFAAAALLMGAGTASAATTFTLDLTGSAFSTFTQDVPGFHLDRGIQEYGGLDASHTLTVGKGDTVEATILFDTAYTIPGSVDLTSVSLNLSNDAFPGGLTHVFGETHFFLEGVEVIGGKSDGLTTGQFANGIGFAPPNNGPIKFDKITSTFKIDQYDGDPVTLTRATGIYTLFTAVPVTPIDPVPEPGAWALMILGFGGVGTAVRSRRRLDVGARVRT